MKIKLTSLSLSFIACASVLAADPPSLTQDPAYLPIDKVLDLKVAKPEVNVNLPRFLLMDAVSELESDTNNTFAASGVSLKDLIREIRLIRLLVISGNETNQAHIDQGVAKLTKMLETNWTAIVSVPDENVGVYAMSDPAGNEMTGIAVLIHNDGETVIANIVGHISIGKLIKLASSIDTKKGASLIPKELIEKLSGLSGKETKEEPKDPSKPKTN